MSDYSVTSQIGWDETGALTRFRLPVWPEKFSAESKRYQFVMVNLLSLV